MRTPTAELLAPDVRQLIDDRRWRELRDVFATLEPADSSDVIETIDPDEDAAIAFRLLPRALSADVFAHFDTDTQERFLELLGGERAVRLLEDMDADDRAALVEELPVEVATPLLQRLSPAERRATQTILGYPEESVGRLMTPDYVRVRPEWTVRRALEHIRQWGRDAETVHWVYVVDADRKLIDDLHIRRFLLADLDTTVEQLMDDEFVALHATDDREDAVRAMARYDRTALPVIDSLGLLVGIVTVDDVADVAEAEFTEDVHKLGGLEALDEPYMTTRFVAMVKKRGVWLVGLFALQLCTIFAMRIFEDELAKAVVLALFVPLIISSGGNTGTQAASLLVRALALNEVRFADWWAVARKELLTGLVLGSALGVLGLVTVVLLGTTGLVETEYLVRLGFVVGTSVVGIVIWGTLIGSLLPMLLDRMGLDPATSSSPLVATLMDVSGLTIYFAVALLLLRGTLL